MTHQTSPASRTIAKATAVNRSGDAESPQSWIEVGRACQRFLLTATHLGLKCAFINQAVEVAHLRSDLAALIGEAGKRPDLVLRYGYGPTMPFSTRRPVASTRT